MVKSRLYPFLSRLVKIKPGEEFITVLLFCYFFLLTAPYGIIKSLRNDKILRELGPEALPIAYISTAVIIGFVVAFHSKIQSRIPRQLLIRGSFLFFILSCMIFLFPYPTEWKWMALLYWVWANVFVMVLVTQFWMVVNDIFDPRQAKRLIGFFGSGGILGGIVGGVAVGTLAETSFSSYLLVLALAFLFLNLFVTRAIFSWKDKFWHGKENLSENEKKKQLKWGFWDCFQTVRSSRYLLILAVIVALTLIVSTLIDYQYNHVVNAHLKEGVRLSFFGWFNSGMMLVAFFLQLLLTSNFIQRFGIRVSLLLYPLVLIACSIGIAFFPVILFAVILKGGDKSLSYTINQSVRELLYIPVSEEQKYKAKIFIDMFVNRVSKGIGGILLLFIYIIGFRQIAYISLFTVFIIVIWGILNIKASREYTAAVRERLDMSWRRADDIISSQIDPENIKLVFDAIENRGKSPILFSMNLFELIKQDKLTPEIKKLLFSSSESKTLTLETYFDDVSLLPEKNYEDQNLLEEDIKEITSLGVYQDIMKDYFDKVFSGKGKDSSLEKMEIAKGLGFMDDESPLLDELRPLLIDESPDVVRYAMESVARLKKREYVPLLIEKLKNIKSRYDSGIALKEFGLKITGMLSDYLTDEDEDFILKKEIVSVLGENADQETIDICLMILKEENGLIRFDIIDMLDKVRSKSQNIVFQESQVKTLLKKEIKNHYLAMIEIVNSHSKEQSDLIVEKIQRDESETLANIFKLLGLIYSHNDIINAFQNLKKGTSDSIAYTIELLDNILPTDIKEMVFPLAEQMDLSHKIKIASVFIKENKSI